MANSGVRHVKCPRCQSVLQEPGAPIYQCGGCGATLRAKNCSGESPSSSSLPPPQSRHSGSPAPDARSSGQLPTGTTSRRESGDLVLARRHGSGDVASSSSTPDAPRGSRQRATAGTLVSARKPGSGDVASTSSIPDATSGRRQAGTDTAIQRGNSDASSARSQVSPIERNEHDSDTNHHSPELLRQRYAGNAERSTSSPGIRVSLPRGIKDADTEKRSKSQVELPDAARKKHSGETAAAHPQFRVREEPAPKSAQAPAEPQPSRAAPAVAGGKPPSPPRHDLQAEEDLAPLRQKILKTVDELRGDLSELFRKSPDFNPPKTRARPPHLPNKQEGHASRGGSAARAVKPGQVAAAPPPPPPRGLPSRRYRRCRADPCCDDVQPRTCHHGCCRHHGRQPECSNCRGHCCRPIRAQEPSSAPRKPPAAANKRHPRPRHHCRPVLKGAPFITCSSCFKLVQVPADFAVATNRLRKLRCGSCSAVLSYSYRDPARKKAQDSADQFSTDGSEVHEKKGCDPFAPFVDEFGLSSHSTTEDERPLQVSRNTSFDTVDGVKGVGRLHRLMGYGSASELLRHSPDLYESFDERTTPDYDRKGKGVCVDAEDDGDFDDSDEEDSCILKRSAARGAVWPLPGQGAIRIRS